MSKLNRMIDHATPKLSWQDRDRYKNASFDTRFMNMDSVLFCIFIICMSLVLILLAISDHATHSKWVYFALSLMILSLLASGYAGWLMRRKRLFKLAELLRKDEIRPGICPKCYYALNHSESAMCPECGHEVGPADQDRE